MWFLRYHQTWAFFLSLLNMWLLQYKQAWTLFCTKSRLVKHVMSAGPNFVQKTLARQTGDGCIINRPELCTQNSGSLNRWWLHYQQAWTLCTKPWLTKHVTSASLDIFPHWMSGKAGRKQVQCRCCLLHSCQSKCLEHSWIFGITCSHLPSEDKVNNPDKKLSTHGHTQTARQMEKQTKWFHYTSLLGVG